MSTVGLFRRIFPCRQPFEQRAERAQDRVGIAIEIIFDRDNLLMGIGHAGFRQIDHFVETEAFAGEIERRTDDRGIDCPGPESGKTLGLAAALQNDHILVRLETVFLHRGTHRGIGRRTVAADHDLLAAKILRRMNLRPRKNTKRKRVDHAGDEIKIGAAQVCR